MYKYVASMVNGSTVQPWLSNPHLSALLVILLHMCSLINLMIDRHINITSNKNFILKYFRCRDGKRTETRIGMEGICITHSCIPLYTVYMQHIMAHSGGMQEWVIQIPSIPILVSVLFPSLHLKYFRIKFLLLVCIVFMRMRTKPHPHPVISEATPTSSYKKGLEVLAVFALVCTFPAFS